MHRGKIIKIRRPANLGQISFIPTSDIIFNPNRITLLIPLIRQGFKENVDAENLMPLTSSDFRNPVCLEMRLLKESAEQYMNQFGFPELDVEQTNNVNSVDLNSMDSSDTFASCTTHPFNSQGIQISICTEWPNKNDFIPYLMNRL